MIEKRPFATGSKPGPDAVDQYLESIGYYRKHVARDSSSLFRVISEHIFDIQKFHNEVRQTCARFIEAHKDDYSKEINKNFYNYVTNLRKNRTPGTTMDLRVMAKIYKKNVILFEPTNNMQVTMINYVVDKSYDSERPFRVFYSHRDGHFDIIFKMEHIEKIAECQSIVYAMLYQDVFKLPDVQYCTERMLHDQEGKTTIIFEDDPSKYQNQAGEIVEFDSPETTNCVLKDPRTCHFHNQENFEEVVEEYKNAVTVINRSDDPSKLKIYKPIDGFLHQKHISCVRQLLDENITPFPYKAAKALDKSIYRNTEFEVWNESRKLQRMKWLGNIDYDSTFDDKWMFYDRRGFPQKQILDENGYEALDEETKKKYVVLDPINNYNYFIPPRDSVELTVYPANVTHHNNSNFNNNNSNRGNYNRRGVGHRRGFNHSYQNRSHYQNQPPFQNADFERDNANTQTQINSENQESNNNFYQQQQQQENFATEVPQETMQASQSREIYNPQQQQWFPLNFSTQTPQPMPIQIIPPHVMPYGNFSIPPPTEATMQHSNSQNQLSKDVMNLIRDSEWNGKINNNAQESVDQNGNDLPMNDIQSLRFYYNLGVRYFLAAGLRRRLESLELEPRFDTLQINDTSEKKKEEDSPAAPTNTPVSTKNASSTNNNNNGSAFRNFDQNRRPTRGGYGGNYRPWSSVTNSSSGGSNNPIKKEIKFNNNVKNVHKNEQQKNIQLKISPSKISPSSTTVRSLSPIPHEPPHVPSLQDCQVVTPAPQFYQPFQYMPQPQSNIGYIYHNVNEEMAPFAIQAYTQSPQPYPYQGGQYFAPNQQPYQMYYSMPPNVLPQPQPIPTDTSMISNDSGVAEQQVYQQPMQYYQQFPAQQPVPVYYAAPPQVHAQTPQIQAPQITPVFPAPTIVQTPIVQQQQTQVSASVENLTYTRSTSEIEVQKENVMITKNPSA